MLKNNKKNIGLTIKKINHKIFVHLPNLIYSVALFVSKLNMEENIRDKINIVDSYRDLNSLLDKIEK